MDIFTTIKLCWIWYVHLAFVAQEHFIVSQIIVCSKLDQSLKLTRGKFSKRPQKSPSLGLENVCFVVISNMAGHRQYEFGFCEFKYDKYFYVVIVCKGVEDHGKDVEVREVKFNMVKSSFE